jgi:hypothetical protein
VAGSKEREGKRKREMLFLRHHGERNPRGQKAQESIASHLELNVWGGKRMQLLRGDQTAEACGPGRFGLERKRKSAGRNPKGILDPRRGKKL